MGTSCDVDINIVDDFLHKNRRCTDDNMFRFTPVSENDIKAAMNEIKSKATGSDGLSIQMIKAVSTYAISAITHLINKSITSGKFPANWKTNVVHPLPKGSAQPESLKQLRPISILPAMSKILEKITLRQMNSFIHKENILPRLQSGFRKNHSTCTALVNLFSDLIDDKDKGKYSSLVLLDYSQAFDSISHELLLAKLKYYGFHETSIEWVKTYLTDRAQVTKLGNETSGALIRNRGVPQGSCLGPVLFNLYTSDFPGCVQNCTVHQYADDCQLHFSYKPSYAIEAMSLINADLKSISRWSAANGLRLNVGKCSVLHLAPIDLEQTLSESGVGVVLDGERLAVCGKARTLGVVVDRGLSFSDHVTCIIQRAVGRLRGLYRLRNVLPENVKLQLMQSLVLSLVHYCYPAFGNSISKEDAQRMQTIQNAAIRFVFSLRRFDHVSSYRNDVKMLPMDSVCKVLTNCMTHKILTVGEPQYLFDRLQLRGQVSQRSTRHDQQLHFRKVRLETGRGSFSYFGPIMYNRLNDDLKSLPGPSFKKHVKCVVSNA